ncbi:stomatin-like protein stl-1 [Watersipora subatra]|uniref:stomatin-like protein stl-1 n=1 Tax=Watersipora subatra TaxID=2589382 RepID=UPI00355BD23E
MLRGSKVLQLALKRQQLSQQARLLSAKVNTIICFVPQQEAWIIERFGKFHKTLEPGLNIILPVVDSIKYIQSLKEIAIDVPHQSAISSDNVVLTIDGVLYVKVIDPNKASYGVEDAEYAVTQLAQTTMRSEIGRITMDNVFKERDALNQAIVDAINKASLAWGITCLRYEIRDIKMPDRVSQAMQLQVEAERNKRAQVLESEGIKIAEINRAEGNRQAAILKSEAERAAQINIAEGEANAILTKAKAKAASLELLSAAIGRKNGHDAVSLNIAEQYVSAFSNLAKESNTVLLPSDTGNMSNMVAQAMTIYKNLDQQKISAAQTPPYTDSADDEVENTDGNSL